MQPKQPADYPDFVSNSPAPTGSKAFYTYLHNEKVPAKRWSHAPALLNKADEHQLLIMVEPSFTPNKETMNQYISFMEAGNTILLLKNNPDGMFGLETEPATAENGEGPIKDETEASYKAEKSSPFRIITDEKEADLLHDNDGSIAAKKSYHDGELITAVEPDWITNDKILEDDHLPLLFSILEEGNQHWDTIYFDEYIHGAENASSITALYPNWLLILGFQAVLFAIIGLWYQGKRFGPISVPREETIRFSNERIKALAAWYQRGKLYHDSLTKQASYIRLLMQEHWGIPYHKDWMDIGSPLKQKWQTLSGPEIDTFLRGLTAVLRKQRVSKQDYLLWSKKINKLQKEVEEG